MVRLHRPDPAALRDTVFDVVVVGGGIFGACVAWDAALRGLSVVLVERGDFAEATSASCFKMVHGGLRYLQHADLPRVRESAGELSALLRVAPHLVEPLPILIPTYGHGRQGKEILRLALRAYDLATLDRNRALADPARRIDPGYTLSRDETLRRFPGLAAERLTGSVVFHDGQMWSPPRLALAIVKSAAQAGAVSLNHVEATGFLRDGPRIAGVSARDRLGGAGCALRGRVVVNACGPWAERLLGAGLGLRLAPPLTFSRDAYFVVRRRLTPGYGLALPARTKDPDAILSRGRRHLFVAPWHDATLIGVWHTVYTGDPDALRVTPAELAEFLAEVNEAYPALSLGLGDVALGHAGLVLFGENRPGATDLSYGHRSRVIDHARADGLEGLVTVVGVRYTVARGVAAQVVDLAAGKLGRATRRPATDATPVYGGDIPRVEDFVREVVEGRPRAVPARSMRALARAHGSRYGDVLAHLDAEPAWAETLGRSAVIAAEVVHAARAEMARTLADVVFRRTDLATAGDPGAAVLGECAALLAAELGWDAARTREEIRAVQSVFPSFRRCPAGATV
jgi:glycerol-3-phosphate dehydrogenase